MKQSGMNNRVTIAIMNAAITVLEVSVMETSKKNFERTFYEAL